MSPDTAVRSAGPVVQGVRLEGHLTAPAITCLVLANLAPITGVFGPLALALALGNGAGLPGAFLIATLIMLCFAAGYAALSRRVLETGAFYAYITKGLGRPAGGAAAFVALLTYNAGFCGMCGVVGYFTWILVHTHTGLDIPWWTYTVVALAFIAVVGRRRIDVGARVQMGLLFVECAALAAFDLGVVVRYGLDAFPARSFSPEVIWGGGWNGFSIAMMFVFFLFGGIEMAAVYAEEARNPDKSIARATYGSVLAIGGIHLITAWCLIVAAGFDQVQRKALENPGEFGFNIFGQVLGSRFQVAATVLVITSLLASMIGVHQGIVRYILALSRHGLLPRVLQELHPDSKAPQRASAAAIGVAVVATVAVGMAGGDPMKTFFSSLSGLTTIGTLLSWVAASLAFIVYFRRHCDPRWWTTFVLPVIALLALSACLYLALTRYRLVTGVDNVWINNLPCLLIPTILVGAGTMLYLRAKQPKRYAGIWPDAPDSPANPGELQPSGQAVAGLSGETLSMPGERDAQRRLRSGA